MEITFKGKIWKAGESFVITIPKAYLDNGQLQISEESDITIMQK